MRHRTPSSVGSRHGFTLIEVLISMTLLLFVLGAATNAFRRQSTILSEQSGRLEAQQTAQFALSLLDRELRLAGIGVADMQPIVVQADSMAVTFNADLVSNVVGDPAAVYIDADADNLMSSVFRSSNKLPLPHSTFFYPDSTHMESVGAPSGAETISFWLSADSSSEAANDYVLWRRINHGDAALAARGIVGTPGEPFFQFFQPDSAGKPKAVSATKLPLYHNAATHGVESDTGKYAIVDSIYLVRVRMTVMFHDRKGPVYRKLDQSIRLMNAGLIRRTTCGDPPLGVTPTAVAALDTIGQPNVTLTWSPSADETGGEGDVERYALFRRLVAASSLDEPFASVPAGSANYTWVDSDVATGQEWVYGVAAQDCTPNSSSVASTTSVLIP